MSPIIECEAKLAPGFRMRARLFFHHLDWLRISLIELVHWSSKTVGMEKGGGQSGEATALIQRSWSGDCAPGIVCGSVVGTRAVQAVKLTCPDKVVHEVRIQGDVTDVGDEI